MSYFGNAPSKGLSMFINGFYIIGDTFYMFAEFRNTIKESVTSGLDSVFGKSSKNQLPLVESMQYDELVGYFFDKKPEDDRVKKFLLMREKHELGWVYTQCFLNDTDEVLEDESGNLYGRKFVVKNPDKEINDLFGESNSVILE
jgi:hypothetical protein